ncbi:MAG: GNAT family N-acetyltransferase [Roseivirga sp.]
MWPDRPLNYIKLPHDAEGLHYGLFVDGRLTSVISLFIEGDTAQFRKFATASSAQGKGYGSQLLSHLIDQAKLKAVKHLWCNARIDKSAYYERFGMVKTETTFSKGGIGYVVMEIVLSK